MKKARAEKALPKNSPRKRVGSGRLVRREYPCTECAGDAFVGFSNWSGPTGKIIGKKERICSACAKKRNITFSFHAQPNDKDEPRGQKNSKL